jgi:hypothetical protein
VVQRFRPEVNFAGGSSRPIPVEVQHGTKVMTFSSLVSRRACQLQWPNCSLPFFGTATASGAA